MLIKCPECSLQVSDKAISCPHCGYPLKPTTASKIKKAKRKRLPNGFGQISEIKGRNLQNRFRAMITEGYTEEGRPICRTLKPRAYFPTYNDAYEALIRYNQKPYKVGSNITVRQLYDIWFEKYKKSGVKQSSINGIASAFKLCEPLYDYSVNSLEPFFIKDILEKIDKRTMVKRSKLVLGMLFDYAVENGLLATNPVRQFRFSRLDSEEHAKVAHAHIDYTNEEMRILWENVSNSMTVQMMIVQAYMGWRPQELCKILICNVYLDKGFIIGGMKTKAGTNRSVPIHSKIRNIIENQYKRASASKSDTLFYTLDDNGRPKEITYNLYSDEYAKITKYLNINNHHRPHDGRVHFITSCKKYNVDEYAIKYMAGHTIADITESIYTKRGIGWLKDEIEKIKE